MNITTTTPKINRRALIAGTVAATLGATALTGDILDAAPTDPLVTHWIDHQRLLAAWVAEDEANQALGAGIFDTPESLRLEREKRKAALAISRTIATAPEGLAVQLEFVIQEVWGPCEGEFGSQIYATMLAGAKQLAGAV